MIATDLLKSWVDPTKNDLRELGKHHEYLVYLDEIGEGETAYGICAALATTLQKAGWEHVASTGVTGRGGRPAVKFMRRPVGEALGAEPIIITGDLSFMLQRDKGRVVVQCMECAEYEYFVEPEDAQRWQVEHRPKCPGDDEEALGKS